MGLPQDSLWPVRRDHIRTLTAMLKDNLLSLQAIQNRFDSIDDNLGNRLKEYSEKLTRYGQFFNGIYAELYDSEEYKDADQEVNGLPSDVVLQLIDGLKVDADSGLQIDDSGNWISSIYMIMMGLEMSVQDMNDIFSYIQYGMNTWETAKAITFPDSFPSFDDVVPGAAVPQLNMIYDWLLKEMTPRLTIRGILIKENLSSTIFMASNKGMFLSVSIGEGMTTKITKVDFPDGNDLLLIPWTSQILDPETNEFIDYDYLIPGDIKVSINILVQRQDKRVVYGASIYLVKGGGWYLQNETKGPGTIYLLNHTTYSLYLPRYFVTYSMSQTNTLCEVQKLHPYMEWANNDYGVIFLWQPQLDTYTVRRLDDNKRQLIAQYYTLSGVNDLRKKSTFFVRQCTGGAGLSDAPMYDFSSAVMDLSVTPSVRLGTFEGWLEHFIDPGDGTGLPVQSIRMIIKLSFTRVYTIVRDGSLDLFTIVDGDGVVADDWKNIANPEYRIGQWKTLGIDYDRDLSKFILKGDSTGSVRIPLGTTIEASLTIPIVNQRGMFYTAWAESFYCNTMASTGEVFLDRIDPDTETNQVVFGMYGTYNSEFLSTPDPQPLVGSCIKVYGRDGTSLTSPLIGVGIFPKSTLQPSKSFTGPRHYFNVYLTSQNVIIYEFVVRIPVGWQVDKEFTLLSKGVLEKDYVPAQNLMMQVGESSYIVIRNDGTVVLNLSKYDQDVWTEGLRFTYAYPSIPRFFRAANSRTVATPITGTATTLPSGYARPPEPKIKDTREEVYYEWKGVNIEDFKQTTEGTVKKFTRVYASKESAFPINRVKLNASGGVDTTTEVKNGTDADLMKKELLTDFSVTKCYLYTADSNAMKIRKLDIVPVDVTDTATASTCYFNMNIECIVGKFPWALTNINALVSGLTAIIEGLISLEESWENINRLEYFNGITAHQKVIRGHTEQQAQLLSRVLDQAQASQGLGAAISRGVEGLLKKMDQYAERFKTV